MYQFYIAATCSSYPTVNIIRLHIRGIKRKLFTLKLHLVINIFSGGNLGLTNVITYISTYEGWNFNSGNYLFTTDTK